jgi:HEAT repeat protein
VKPFLPLGAAVVLLGPLLRSPAADDPIELKQQHSWVPVVKRSDAGLLKTLARDVAGVWARARQELARREAKLRPALLKLFTDPDQPEPARVAALGALESMWHKDAQRACEGVLQTGDADLRRLAADALGRNVPKGDEDAQNALLKVLNDNDLSVKRSVALAMGRIAASGAADALVNTLAFDDSDDRYLRDGLVRALESLGKQGIDRLLALADSGVKKDLDLVVEVFVALRTRPAADALPGLLKNPHLSIAQRADLIRSYRNYLLKPPVSPEPVLDYLLANPKEASPVKLAALEVLSGTEALKSAKGAKWLLTLLEERNPGVRVSVIKAIADARLVKAAPALVKLLADRSRPVAEREAVLKALRVLNDRSAVAVLKEVLADSKDPSPEAARLRGEAFRTLVALDEATAAKYAREFLNHKDVTLQAEAVRALGSDADGARLVGKLFLDKKLPRELLPQVSAVLRKHADRDAELAALYAAVRRLARGPSNGK